jgi:hypothetical protein
VGSGSTSRRFPVPACELSVQANSTPACSFVIG